MFYLSGKAHGENTRKKKEEIKSFPREAQAGRPKCAVFLALFDCLECALCGEFGLIAAKHTGRFRAAKNPGKRAKMLCPKRSGKNPNLNARN